MAVVFCDNFELYFGDDTLPGRWESPLMAAADLRLDIDQGPPEPPSTAIWAQGPTLTMETSALAIATALTGPGR